MAWQRLGPGWGTAALRRRHHSAPYGLGGILARLKENKTFFVRPVHSTNSRPRALAISNVAMMVVLQTADECIGLGLSADLSENC